MGLLARSDWQAKWIGYDAPPPEKDDDAAAAANADPNSKETLNLNGLSWMWFDGGDVAQLPQGARYFRKVITIPPGATISSAHGIVSADNRFEFFVNGTSAAHGSDFRRTVPVDFAPLLHEGENVIAVWAQNDSPGPAGLIGRFKVKLRGQPSNQYDLDTTWLATDRKIDGWNTQPRTPDEAAWRPARAVANHGEAPWGDISPRKLVLPPPPYLRKTFEATKPIARATAYASALGLYELHVNGQRVGQDHFTPGWTDYAKRVHYQTYDVTPLVKPGANAIAAMLGDGWYAGYFGFTGNRELYGKEPRVIAQLEIEYADGSRETVVTDASWKATYGPIREADMLMGCTYDASQEINGWDTPQFDDSKWDRVAVTDSLPAVLQASPGEPVQTIEELRPKKITTPQPNVYVFDLGQNMVGWVRLKLAARKGDKVRLRYAEMLNPDGTLYTTALRGARATDTYIAAADGEFTFEPKFTFHGFRYVELTGAGSQPPLDAITGVVVHTRMARTGDFECSNPLVNQLVHNIIWGQKGNYLEVPTDCPQRDERLGWTGDAQFFVPTASYNFDVAAFFNKWLVDLNEDSANPEGAFGSVAPDVLKGGYGATAWADAGIVCPYTIWHVYGDTRVIRDHYASMAKYIDYLHKTSKDLVRTQGAYGDWVNLGGGASSEVIGTSYFAYVTRLMSEMAAAIGKTNDAAKYAKLAADIREAFIKSFVTPDGHIKDSSQTGYALAFSMDLLPADENLRKQAAEHFVEEIAKRDWHLATGFIGTPRLLPALTRAGKEDVAYRLLLTETFPSWLYQVKLGATTMWERWDGWTPEKGFQDPGMNSFNHYAFGSVGEFLYRTVGGIDTDGPGYRKIRIAPQPSDAMQFARASFESIRGPVKSEWRVENNELKLTVSIPPNTTATVHVPTKSAADVKEGGRPARDAEGVKFLRSESNAAVFEVGSGTYTFTAPR
jgi:alpha-L-rhamnosidase